MATEAMCEHAGDDWFDRTFCEAPCGQMHTRCADCGAALDFCPWEHGETPPSVRAIQQEARAQALADAVRAVEGLRVQYEDDQRRWRLDGADVMADRCLLAAAALDAAIAAIEALK